MSDEVLDMPDFLERVQDDKELLIELLDLFEEDYEGKRKQLSEAIAQGNVQEIRNIAHSVKGASGNISAKKLRPLFAQIENNTKADNLDQIQEILNLIDEEYKALLVRINEIRDEYSV